MSVFSPKKGQNITIITKSGKIRMSVGGFLEKKYFLTSVTLKFYQKSNSSPKILCFQHFKENIL